MNVLLDTVGLDLQIMTATISASLVFQKEVVDQKLKGKSGVWDFLVQRWEEYPASTNEKQWIMWGRCHHRSVGEPTPCLKSPCLNASGK
jgi:purine nucleosidase